MSTTPWRVQGISLRVAEEGEWVGVIKRMPGRASQRRVEVMVGRVSETRGGWAVMGE